MSFTRNTSNMDLGNCSQFFSTARGGKLGSSVPFTKRGNYLYGHATVLSGDRVWAFGGYHLRSFANWVYIYNISTETWSGHETAKASSVALYGKILVGFLHNDRLIAYTYSGRPLLLVLNCLLLDDWSELEVVGEVPAGKRYLSGAYHEANGRLYLCNGPDLYRLSLEFARFERLETKGLKPRRRGEHACCIGSETLFVSGGDSGADFLALHALSLDLLTWSTIQPVTEYVPPPRRCFTISYIKGRIYVFGGMASKRSFDLFSLKKCKWVHIGEQTKALSPEEEFLIRGAGVFGGTSQHSEIHTSDKLIVFGGFGGKFLFNNPLIITPDTTS